MRLKYLFNVFVFISSLVSCKTLNTKSFLIKESPGLIPNETRSEIINSVESGSTPGIAFGVIDHEKMETFCLGFKKNEGEKSGLINKETIFEIGSVTKVFTGLLLLEFIDSQNISLDTKISELIAEEYFSTANPKLKDITLKQLLNHTSGLPYMPGNFRPENPHNPFINYNSEMLLQALSEVELQSEPGVQYEYSNMAIALIGEAISSNTGKNYEEYLTNKILLPLELDNTRVSFNENMFENLALGHQNGSVVPNWNFKSFEAAGGLKSNLIDMMRFLWMNLYQEESKSNINYQITHINTRKKDDLPQVGIAWHIEEADGKEIIWHNGGTSGYRSYIGFIKNEKKAVVVLTNSTYNIDQLGRSFLSNH